MATLRESGTLERDADIVIFLHQKNEKYKENNSTLVNNLAKVKIMAAINKNGPTGSVTIDFMPRFTKFVDKERQCAKISC
ncbi:replicative DNA helicase [Borrelia yangtzensis]|uniref:Replicative DNA helicase n=1 Tax=Borreliella yangtzensis TaxID=683292 RepID=A0ABR6PAV9_9SPIR|nr:replicative DNA helicase [Borreliella yangtzensis]